MWGSVVSDLMAAAAHQVTIWHLGSVLKNFFGASNSVVVKEK